MYCWSCKKDVRAKPNILDKRRGVGSFICKECKQDIYSHQAYVSILLFDTKENAKNIEERITNYNSDIKVVYDRHAFKLFLDKLGELKEVSDCIAGNAKGIVELKSI